MLRFGIACPLNSHWRIDACAMRCGSHAGKSKVSTYSSPPTDNKSHSFQLSTFFFHLSPFTFLLSPFSFLLFPLSYFIMSDVAWIAVIIIIYIAFIKPMLHGARQSSQQQGGNNIREKKNPAGTSEKTNSKDADYVDYEEIK